MGGVAGLAAPEPGAAPELADHPVQQRHDARVGEQHGLGPPGRARRERHEGHVLVERAGVGPRLDPVDGHQRGRRRRRQHVGDLVGREPGVERDVHRAGPPDAEQRGDQVGAVGQHDADRLSRPDAGGRQLGGCRLGLRPQVGPRVVDAAGVDRQRRGIGRLDGREQQVGERHGPSPARVVGGCHSGSRFSANARGPSVWSGWPHIDTRSSAPAWQASVRPMLERAPQRPLGGRHRGRRVPGDRLGQLLGPLAQPLGRVDDLADHPQLVGPLGRHPLVAADERHAHHGLDRHLADQPDGLDATRPGRSTRGGRRTGRRTRRCTMSASATQWNAAAGADAVDRGDDRLPHVLVPRR